MRPLRAPSIHRAALAAAAALAALALASCSYLLGDPYGDYMQKADAWVSLRADAKAETGLSLSRVDGMCYAEALVASTRYRYLFVQAEFTDGTSRQLALGYPGLALTGFIGASVISGPFGAWTDYGGLFCVGNSLYAPADLSLSSGGLPAKPWLLVYQDDNDSPSTYNHFLFSDSSNDLIVESYDAAWGSVSSRTWQIGAAGEKWNLARALELADGRICLLMIEGDGGSGTLKAVIFKDAAAFGSMLAGGVADFLGTADGSSSWTSDSIPVQTNNGSYDNPSGVSAWITEDGIVAATEGSNGAYDFKRYPLGAGGAIDGYSLGSGWNSVYHFDPAGDYWFLFDQSAGRLVRMRTWWK